VSDDWVSLRDYVDARFNALQLAIEKQDVASEHRFTSINEFRAVLGDQQRTFINRREHDALLDRVTVLERGAANSAGKNSGITVVWGVIVSVVLIAIAVAEFIWKH
jgi:hypothetical protein